MENLKCSFCSGQMVSTTKTEKNMGMQIFGVFLFIFGLCLLFAFPFGTLFGLMFMIVSIRLGYEKKKIWLCPDCGIFIERGK